MQYLPDNLEHAGCINIGFDLYDKYVQEKLISEDHDERITYEYNRYMIHHNEYSNKFPHYIEVHCNYDFINKMYDMLHNLFGLPHGECEYSDIMPNHCMDDLFLEFKITIGNKTFELPDGSCYSHCHMGDWILYFLANSGYDEGYNRIYFKNKEKLGIFLTQLILRQNSQDSTYHILD